MAFVLLCLQDFFQRLENDLIKIAQGDLLCLASSMWVAAADRDRAGWHITACASIPRERQSICGG
jgi:hypothetical protein